MQRGRFGHRPRNDPRYYNGAYPFIQTGNIVEASEGNERIKYTQTLNELGLSTSRLVDEKVLVITIAANIGYTAILDYAACFPDSLVALTPKDSDLTLEYLNIYIRLIRQYIENLAPQAAQKNINLKQLGELPLIVPDKYIQQKIVSIMESAYLKKNQLEEEMKTLLESVDTYLLQELGMNLSSDEKDKLENRRFYINSSDLLGCRFDPYYHIPTFDMNLKYIENGKNPVVVLKKVIVDELIKGTLPNESQKGGECKVIQISNINADGTIQIEEYITSKNIYSAKQELHQGDILIVITGATIGKIGYWDYDGEYYLGGDIVKFNTGNTNLNEIYAALLRTKPYQLQIKRCITGTTNGHLALKNVNSLMLPYIADEKTQETIAMKLSFKRKKMQLLKQEVRETMRFAKLEIAKILLGDNI
ncbi:MAG: restriction endonuclease subunit S [Clostridium sp.]|nr:restriction endonuclease subunit S [Clostridium sp.]